MTTFGKNSPHPRSYGTYPRVIVRYVREKPLLNSKEAVRKMTHFLRNASGSSIAAFCDLA